MASNRNRMLSLFKILYEQTDEKHKLKRTEIIKLLEQQGIKCDRRSFYADKKALVEAGIDIIYKEGYYIASRKFDLAEIKFLVDYISSSETITVEQTDELKNKLLSLLSAPQREIIDEQFYVNPNIKSKSDDELMPVVNGLIQAIHKQKQIKFKYKNIRKNKSYVFSPYALVSSNQRYYLIGYNHDAKKIYHFKVEKINELKISNNDAAPIDEVCDYDNVLDVSDYLMKTYNMYSGEETEVTMRFTEKILEEMKKHFENVKIVENSNKNERFIETKVNVSVSDGFISFVLSMGDNIQVLEPEWVIDKIKNKAKDILAMYDEKALSE